MKPLLGAGFHTLHHTSYKLNYGCAAAELQVWQVSAHCTLYLADKNYGKGFPARVHVVLQALHYIHGRIVWDSDVAGAI